MGTLVSATANVPFDWPTVSPSTVEVLEVRIDKMLSKVARQKETSSDRELLYSIFKKTQKEFLHKYKQYADLDELVYGNFDCLTATSLFATVLTRAGYSYRIIETNYHIFLLVTTSQGEALIETTDRFAGFITSQEEITRTIEEYRSQSPQSSANETTYRYDFEVFGEIEVTHLAGLLYFNQAVKAYNEGKWLSCAEKIVMANKHHDSPRVNALASVLLYTIDIKDLSAPEKEKIRSSLEGFGISSLPTASR